MLRASGSSTEPKGADDYSPAPYQDK